MILGISGEKRSGKDTFYQIIKEIYPSTERFSFGDKIKQSSAAALNIDQNILEDLKDSGCIMVFDEFGNALHALSVREYLQYYGTEAHRDIIDQDIWVDQVLKSDFDHGDKVIVITDVRFPNEAERIRKLGGKIIKINRDNNNQDNHISEQHKLDIDFTIDNNGTIENLKSEVQKIWNIITEEEKIKEGIFC